MAAIDAAFAGKKGSKLMGELHEQLRALISDDGTEVAAVNARQLKANRRAMLALVNRA